MEKLSSFERVVGSISETDKEQILQDRGEIFNDQIFEDLKGKEKEKTEEELQIIDFANQVTNEIRRKYDLENFDIPSRNIHMIPEKHWPKEGSAAFYNSMIQGIAMQENPSKIMFLERVLHEMIHFKSYNAMQITNSESPILDEYRVGLVVHARNGKGTHFVNLNEAVTEELVKRHIGKLLNDPLFSEEIKKTEVVIADHPRSFTDTGEKLFDEDTLYAEVDGEKIWNKEDKPLFDENEKVEKIITGGFTYQSERKILNTLINKIYERRSGEFETRENVFEVFARGMMTGNVLLVGKLVEKTFGRGTLRRIGELDADINAQENFINSL